MRSFRVVAIICSLFVPTISLAQSATYTFTGTAFDGTGEYASVPDGATITGTYTFDYSAAIPSQSAGISSQEVSEYARGGSIFGTPAPSGFVFSFTAQVDGLTIATDPVNSYDTQSFVLGQGANFTASEFVGSASGASSSSFFRFNDAINTTSFSSAGFPIYQPGAPNLGFIENSLDGGSELRYGLNTLAPASIAPAVPEPGTNAMILVGLALLLSAYRLRRFEGSRSMLSPRRCKI